MNILFFYRIYPSYGGVEVVTTVLANKMVEDGHFVSIASIEQPHMELKSQLDFRVPLIKLTYPVNSQRNVQILHNYIKVHHVDIIINQWGLPFKTTLLFNRVIKGTSCKLISVLHGSPYTSRKLLITENKYRSSNFLLKPICYTIYRLLDLIIRKSIHYNVKHNSRYIVLSKGFIAPLLSYAHLTSSENILAIGNPITIDIKEELINITNKKKQLLYVGRMDLANKNVNRIIESWEKICHKFVDWELVLVGDGPDKRQLVDYVAEHSVDNVVFVGFQKDPPIEYFAKASIFLLTSDLEGFGLVVIESMCYGAVPIVYGSYEAIYDIIDDGKSGFILPKPFNSLMLAEKIEFLIKNEDQRRNMSIEAIKKSKFFTLDAVIKKWYEVLSSVLNNS